MSKKVNESSDSYEDKLSRFEELVAWFESDDIDMAKVSQKYEQALKLAEELRQYLDEVENKIKIVEKKFE